MKKIEFDKVLHFIAGFVIAIVASGVAVAMQTMFNTSPLLTVFITVLAPVLAGLIKEVWDSKKPGNFFDWYDFLATIVGGAIVFVPVIYIYLYG